MELINSTGFQAAYTLGLEPDGRESIVVVIKGTFVFPKDGGTLEKSEKQIPPVMTDVFSGEPGLSTLLYESDFAPYKPCCDVLLNGSAYAPEAKPSKRVSVGLSVGPWKKYFDVVGERVWEKRFFSVSPSEPRSFLTKPIRYDLAYGGVDMHPDDPEKVAGYAQNPIGIGFYPYSKNKNLTGKALPCTEQMGAPITNVDSSYKPMSFGSLCRNFAERVSWAGTYDQDWIDNVFPFLPADFNPYYYQSAPADQQIDYPQGGEEVVLINLTSQGRTSFSLPRLDMPVEFSTRKIERTTTRATLDTILIEPDLKRVMLTWRASRPLKKNMLEMAQVVIGQMPRGWYRAREMGKTYYTSLAELVRSRRAQASDSEPEDAGYDAEEEA